MKLRQMRGESLETVTKPGWEALVTVRKVRGNRQDLTFVAADRNFYATEVWDILFDGRRVPRWTIAESNGGYFLLKGAHPWSTPTIRGTITRIARRAVSNVPEFWRDVLISNYEGRDPQCEECSSTSPVPHIPFKRGHRIHCTCSGCF